MAAISDLMVQWNKSIFTNSEMDQQYVHIFSGLLKLDANRILRHPETAVSTLKKHWDAKLDKARNGRHDFATSSAKVEQTVSRIHTNVSRQSSVPIQKLQEQQQQHKVPTEAAKTANMDAMYGLLKLIAVMGAAVILFHQYTNTQVKIEQIKADSTGWGIPNLMNKANAAVSTLFGSAGGFATSLGKAAGGLAESLGKGAGELAESLAKAASGVLGSIGATIFITTAGGSVAALAVAKSVSVMINAFGADNATSVVKGLAASAIGGPVAGLGVAAASSRSSRSRSKSRSKSRPRNVIKLPTPTIVTARSRSRSRSRGRSRSKGHHHRSPSRGRSRSKSKKRGDKSRSRSRSRSKSRTNQNSKSNQQRLEHIPPLLLMPPQA